MSMNGPVQTQYAVLDTRTGFIFEMTSRKATDREFAQRYLDALVDRPVDIEALTIVEREVTAWRTP